MYDLVGRVVVLVCLCGGSAILAAAWVFGRFNPMPGTHPPAPPTGDAYRTADPEPTEAVTVDRDGFRLLAAENGWEPKSVELLLGGPSRGTPRDVRMGRLLVTIADA